MGPVKTFLEWTRGIYMYLYVFRIFRIMIVPAQKRSLYCNRNITRQGRWMYNRCNPVPHLLSSTDRVRTSPVVPAIHVSCATHTMCRYQFTFMSGDDVTEPKARTCVIWNYTKGAGKVYVVYPVVVETEFKIKRKSNNVARIWKLAFRNALYWSQDRRSPVSSLSVSCDRGVTFMTEMLRRIRDLAHLEIVHAWCIKCILWDLLDRGLLRHAPEYLASGFMMERLLRFHNLSEPAACIAQRSAYLR